MIEKNDRAFPIHHPSTAGGWIEPGLSARDYVAIEAMKALIPMYETRRSSEAESALRALGGASVESLVADRAFEYADALIKASK